MLPHPQVRVVAVVDVAEVVMMVIVEVLVVALVVNKVVLVVVVVVMAVAKVVMVVVKVVLAVNKVVHLLVGMTVTAMVQLLLPLSLHTTHMEVVNKVTVNKVMDSRVTAVQ